MDSIKFKSVDEYFEHVPNENLELLIQIRETIKATVPEAEEVISYNMPAYKYNGILVYFALSKNHIGFYPTPSAIEAFKEDLKNYNYAKGSVQFPLDKKPALKLIAEMTKFRLEENHLKVSAKKKKK